MQIFVNNLKGENVLFNVNGQTSVSELKGLVAASEGVSPSSQRLIFAGRHLVDGALESYGVQKESTVSLVLSLAGGAKKRKKRTYTTPKKIKHKRKNIKMAILHYYKVESDGKIKRLRRECPTPSCGAGIFMAKHEDRQYCGKCGLTFKFKEGEAN